MRRSFLCVLAAAAVWLLTGADKKPPPPDPRAPLMLDEVHYYLTDPRTSTLFFETHFGARQMLQPVSQPGAAPLGFLTILGLQPNEASIEFSPPGPFEGWNDPEPQRWEQELVAPAANLPARYGVYWLGIRTPSLKKAMQRIESRGVTVQERNLIMPIDPRAKASSIYGPDFNTFTLVERSKRKGDVGEFGLDHIQLLVKNVEENVRFLVDVFSAVVSSRYEHSAVVTIAGFPIALCDPEGLDLNRAEVQERTSKHFRFEADHISFLYADLKPAVESALSKGRKFAVPPTRMEYMGKPTPYTYAVIYSPDGMPFELLMEDGRTGPRTRYK